MEGSDNGIPPVLKTGARKGLQVRVLSPPQIFWERSHSGRVQQFTKLPCRATGPWVRIPPSPQIMNAQEVIQELEKHKNPKNVAGMARFGINTNNTLGISIPFLRTFAKRIGKNHILAQELWKSGIHEARILAAFIDNAKLVTQKQMDQWASDFDSWDICDQVCMNLFDKTPWAYDKTIEWAKKKEEFIKRAGFALMAVLAVHDKKAKDDKFDHFFPIIIRESTDERNYVKKAINWALRQIGKRNTVCMKKATACANKLLEIDSKSAHWIASDALREFAKKSLSSIY